jgi:hypothetical protein
VEARFGVHGEQSLAAPTRGVAERFERGTDRVRDVVESDASTQEKSHRLLVGGIEHRGSSATRTAGLHSQLKRRKLVVPHGLERQRRAGHRVERLYPGVRHPFRMRQCVENWQLHRRHAHLRENAAIDELHHRVNHALRMDDDLDAVVRQAEEIVRFDDLERLVRQRRAVDRDLPPHAPRGV